MEWCSYAERQSQIALSMYLDTLKNERTKREYIRLCNNIMEFCQKDFFALTEQDAFDYLHSLESMVSAGSLKISTLNTKMAVLHSISNYMLQHPSITPEDYLQNPFWNPHRLNGKRMLNMSHILSVNEVDVLLSEAKSSPMVFLAIALAFRMGLSTSEMLTLRLKDFFQDAENEYGLHLSRRTVKVPKDIIDLLDRLVAQGICKDYLFPGRRGGHISLQFLLAEYRRCVSSSYSLQDLRNSFIAYSFFGGANATQIAEYLGITQPWLTRYQEVVQLLHVDSAVDYQHICIKQ